MSSEQDITRQDLDDMFVLDPTAPVIPLTCKICGCAVVGTPYAMRLHIEYHRSSRDALR